MSQIKSIDRDAGRSIIGGGGGGGTYAYILVHTLYVGNEPNRMSLNRNLDNHQDYTLSLLSLISYNNIKCHVCPKYQYQSIRRFHIISDI